MYYLHQVGYYTLGQGETIEAAIVNASDSGFPGILQQDVYDLGAGEQPDGLGAFVFGTAEEIAESTGDRVDD